MKVAMYFRVGNKEQLDVETDMKRKEQEFESFCERKKHEIIGEYIPQQRIQMERIYRIMPARMATAE